MKFKHIKTKLPKVKQAHTDEGHFYKVCHKTYPSITTILHSFPNEGIEEWKKRTPNWEDIQNESLFIGTNFHKVIEDFLKNKNYFFAVDKVHDLFNLILPELNKIDNIRAQEKSLFHGQLGIAGQVDCIADFEGEPSIIDFKNSRKPKKEWMLKKSGYYEQVTAYAKMWEYCTGQKIDTGVILISNWDGTTSTHKIHIPDYEDNLKYILERYASMQILR